MIVRVNGRAYELMGAASGKIHGLTVAKQVGAPQVTPTQSIFKLHADNFVEFTINFFNPVDINDMKRFSLPVSYVAVKARSLDGKKHQVEVYLDITAEWVIGDGKANVVWDLHNLANGTSTFNIQLKDQHEFQEENELR